MAGKANATSTGAVGAVVKTPAYRTRRYRLWTYDVLGGPRDFEGWQVNDRYDHGCVEIRCKLEVHNAGTEREFSTYDPTDRQLTRATSGWFGRGLEWDGESDDTLYANRKRDGRPVGELEFEGWVGEDEVSDLERGREVERAEELRAAAPKADIDPFAGLTREEAEELCRRKGWHPDSIGADGADRGL